MLKKLMGALLAAVLLPGMFAGCAGQSGPPAGESAASPEAAAMQSEAFASGGEELRIWTYFTNEKEYFEGMVNALAEEQNLAVSFTHYPFGDLNKQYTLGMVSNDLPDIGMINNPDNAMYIDMGMLQDITDPLEAWGEAGQFYGSSLSTTTQDDRIYGLPFNSNCIILWYDVDLLEEKGLSVPTTWQEFEETCAALTEGSRYGFAMSLINTDEGSFQFMPFQASAGGNIYEMNHPGSVRALTFLTDLVDKGYMSKEVINWTQADILTQFEQGNAAMMLNGPWNIPIIQESSPGKNWSVAPLPVDQNPASALGGEGFSILKGADMERCWPLFQAMFEKENLADWCQATGKLPARVDSAQLKEEWINDPIVSVFVEQIAYAATMGPHVKWPEISTSIYTACQNAITGAMSPEEACDQADTTIQGLLAAAD